MPATKQKLTGRPPKTSSPSTFMTKVAAGQVDGRTKAARFHNSIERNLLAFVQKTAGREPNQIERLLCGQIAWMSTADELFKAAAMQAVNGQGGAEAMAEALGGSRWSSIQTRLLKAITTLSKTLNVQPGKVADSFCDQLASLRVAVPIGGQAPAHVKDKPRRVKRGDA